MRTAAACVLLLGLLGTNGCRPRGPELPPPSTPLMATPDEAFRRSPPPTGSPRPFVEPLVHQERLACGLDLIVLQRPGTSLTSIRYVTRRGGEGWGLDMAGRAWMVGRVMQLTASGPGDADRLAAAGLRVEVAVGMDQASVSVDLTRERVTEAIGRLAEVVRRPNFDYQVIENARRDVLERIARSRRSPRRAAPYWGRALLYGLDHRGAVPFWGRSGVVREVTAPELMALHHIAWRASESALVVVGDVELEAVREHVEEAFDGWDVEAPPRPEREPWSALDSPHVARGLGLSSNAPRSLILFVERAPGRLSRDRVAFELLATVVAGMGSSRLNVELPRICSSCSRVESTFDPQLDGGELLLSLTAGRRALRLVLEVVLGELDRMVEEGPDQDELETAKALIREGARLSFEHNDLAASTLANLFVEGVDSRAFTERLREIDATSTADVRDVARRYLRPDQIPIVVTGPRESVAVAFERAAVSPVVFRR